MSDLPADTLTTTIANALDAHRTWDTPRKERMGTDRRWFCSCGEQLDDDFSGYDIAARHLRHKSAAIAAAVVSVLATHNEQQVETAARALHAHQEYSTCWDDDQAGQPTRKGTVARPLGEHGRRFYTDLARVALAAVSPTPPTNQGE